MKMKPLNDRVVVLRIEEEEQTSGGIIIPDTAKEKPQEGKVVAVGPGKINEEGKRLAMQVKEGDRILFSKYAGSDIKINAIAYSRDDRSRFAVVNLKTVHEGDELEGLAVVAIQENGIVFEREGTKYRVRLGKR